MKTKFSKAALALGLPVLLSACAQQPVTMSQDFWADKTDSIAIVVTKIPEATSHQQGSQGLLDMAIASGAASDLDKHLKTLNLAEFDGIANDLQTRFKALGLNVTGVYTEYELPKLHPMRSGQSGGKDRKKYPSDDFRPLAATLKADRLLLLTPVAAGTVRSYYGFIPLGDPQGAFIVDGELVDLKTDELLWYHQAMPFTKINPPWDEAPDYPNLTDAVFAAMNATRADVLMQLQPAGKTAAVPAGGDSGLSSVH